MDKLKNETQKAEEKMKKEWNIQEVLGGMGQNEQMVLSYFIHTSLQKGRIIGKMEMDGKTAKDISDVLHVPEDVIQKALDEDPFEVIAK